MEPSLTVLVPTFNRPRFLKNCLESIAAQSRKELIKCVIVSENSGCFDSRSVAQRFSGKLPIAYIAQPKVLTAQQHGIALASIVDTEYVAQIADDDMWSRYHLQEAFRCFDTYPDIQAFIGQSIAVRNERCVPFERLSSTLLEVSLGDARSMCDFIVLGYSDMAVHCMASTPFNIWSVVAKSKSHHDALISSAGDPIYGKYPSNDRLYLWRLSLTGNIAVGRNISLFYRRHSESDVQTCLNNDPSRTVHEDFLISAEIARQAKEMNIDVITEWRKLYDEARKQGLAQAFDITSPLRSLLLQPDLKDRRRDWSPRLLINTVAYLMLPPIVSIMSRRLQKFVGLRSY